MVWAGKEALGKASTINPYLSHRQGSRIRIRLTLVHSYGAKGSDEVGEGDAKPPGWGGESFRTVPARLPLGPAESPARTLDLITAAPGLGMGLVSIT